jgi:hypothetical protein
LGQASAEETNFRVTRNHRASDERYDNQDDEFHFCPHNVALAIQQPALSLLLLAENASY